VIFEDLENYKMPIQKN